MIPKEAIYLDVETTGLNPVYGARITCICAKTHTGEWFKESIEDEAQLIKDFFAWLGVETLKDKFEDQIEELERWLDDDNAIYSQLGYDKGWKQCYEACGKVIKKEGEDDTE